ncbi:MAG TPA: PP2C family protein-serine/threonine phosphatase [Mycobacteriales bacterium]|nr:PP2C family protein-serine/threonine phosphatase [Mycobacteriales bacterium]
MKTQGVGPSGGPLARIRAARRSVALLAGPESPRAKSLTLGGLVVLTGIIAMVTSVTGTSASPPLTLAVPLMLGGLLLERRALRVLIGIVGAGFVAEVVDLGWHEVRPGSSVVLAIIAAVAYELVRDRERLGLSTGRGESMLLELRDQLRRQGEVPELFGGWHVDVAQRSAGGSTFGGDFLVSTLTDHGKRLELALVDVSGKGLDAGTRALLLSGALGGLLGAVAPERFLSAANEYLVRQEWDEGFATALHITIDMESGHYRLTSAGHPPAAHYSGGSGRWTLVNQDGMVLGLQSDVPFAVAEGQLARFDALLLYTDGLVEVPGRDLSLGIDRLLGAAEGLIPRGFEAGAELIVEAVAPEASDDRAVVLIWRN